jgi:hypothetical protein
VTHRFVVIAGLVGVLVLGACSGESERDPQVLRAGQLDIKLPPGWKVTDGGVVRPASASKAGDATAEGASTGSDDTVPLAEDDPTTAFFTAIQSFRQCLEDVGTEFRGAPDAANPDSPTNDPAYIEDLSTCAAKSGIVQALQDMQKAQDEMSPAEIEEQNKGYLRWRKCMIGKGWTIAEPKPDAKGRLFAFGANSASDITPPPGQDLFGGDDMQKCAAAAQS